MSDIKIKRPGFWQETDGSLSMRRLLASYFALLAPVMFYLGFGHADKGWIVFIPGIICILAALLLLFFTTWNDITELVQAALGIAPKSPTTAAEGASPAVDSPGR